MVTVGLVAYCAFQPFGPLVAAVALVVATAVAIMVVVALLGRATRAERDGRRVVSVEVSDREMRTLLDERAAATEEPTWRD